MEHNEGHRQSYLEWRARLDDSQFPETARALTRIVELADEMNREFQRASTELVGREGGEAATSAGAPALAGDGSSQEHPHSHAH